jgi:hypothetical protein
MVIPDANPFSSPGSASALAMTKSAFGGAVRDAFRKLSLLASTPTANLSGCVRAARRT